MKAFHKSVLTTLSLQVILNITITIHDIKRKETEAKIIIVNLAGQVFMQIASYGFHTIQRKHLQTTILLGQNVPFIL